MNKLDLIRFLKRLDLKALVFGLGVVLITVFTISGFVKISATGGMAKAQKEAEIAYEVASDKVLQEAEEMQVETVKTTKENKKTTAKKTTKPSKKKDKTTEKTIKDDPYAGLSGTEKINKYFGESVFVGDSVMLGFSNYHDDMEEGFWGEPYFLVAGSFAARTALEPVTDESTHPLYMGERCLVEDAIAQMSDVKRVYLFFGLNDIAVSGVDGTFNDYSQVVKNILAKRSDVEINIISTTYMLAGSENTDLNNAAIAQLNEKLKSFCAQEGYSFIDIANRLGSETSGLQAQYCSDEYLHQTEDAYDVWVDVLEKSIP